jgi:putative PIN family toxin of toxin-antitoxin system
VKFVCDTNVLISGLCFPGGLPDKIIRSFLTGRFVHATSPDIMSECKRVLQKKMFWSDVQATELIQLISETSELVYPIERFSIIKKDETDNRVLECAATAGADFIVSGDKKHLLPLRRLQKIKILSCRDFCDRVGIVF